MTPTLNQDALDHLPAAVFDAAQDAVSKGLPYVRVWAIRAELETRGVRTEGLRAIRCAVSYLCGVPHLYRKGFVAVRLLDAYELDDAAPCPHYAQADGAVVWVDVIQRYACRKCRRVLPVVGASCDD